MAITVKEYREMIELAKKNKLEDLIVLINSFSNEDIESYSLKNWLMLIVAFIGTRVSRDYEQEERFAKILEEIGLSDEEFCKYFSRN